MSEDKPAAFNGTLSAEVDQPDINGPTKEFYRLPFKTSNEITIEVRASNNASILLFDGNKSSDASNIKVEIVLGSDKNSTVSVGLANDDGTGKYPAELVEKDSTLSATHFKVFNVRWHKGRVTVYNHGFKKPFATFDGPPESQFSSVGVRTIGCSGDWVVQGAPQFTTADSTEYKEIVINSGKLTFEVSSARDFYVLLTPEPKWSRNPIVHLVLGGWSNRRSAFWWNFGEVAAVEEAEQTVVLNEYRRFWLKWDAYNIIVGRGDKEAPFLTYNSGATPLTQLNYFSLQGRKTAPFTLYGHVHILDQVNEADVAPKAGSGAGQAGTNEVGYLVVDYQYQQ